MSSTSCSEPRLGGFLQMKGERPLHCLLDDDNLIIGVNVETDRLLKLPAYPVRDLPSITAGHLTCHGWTYRSCPS